ncbi:TPA: carbamate kinase [Escherichia coli]|nr:carbamate kinase [Escherichia coli]
MKELVVVAIGGNSIIKDNASQSIEHQAEAVKAVADTVLEMLASDYDIVLTHGNGPQVGLDLRRAEIAHEREGLPLTPLANCVADTQGGIGYLIQQALNNRLARHGEKKAVTVVTQVEVDKNDPGFAHPTKPIGAFFSESQRDELQKANPDWRFVEDAGRGYRRVVASPEPKRIVEAPAIKALIQQGFVVIGAGGGGIPVVRTEAGDYQSVDAVIDKDLSTALLAREIHADILVITTAAALFGTSVPLAHAGVAGTLNCEANNTMKITDPHYYLDNVLLETGFDYENGVAVQTRTARQTVEIQDGKIVALRENKQHPDATLPHYDAGGKLMLPTTRDMHIHLDKTFYGGPWRSLNRPAGTTIQDMIKLEQKMLPELQPYTQERAEKLIDLLQSKGTTIARSHCNIEPVSGLKNLQNLQAVLARRQTGFECEIVAFPQHGLLLSKSEPLMREAMQAGAHYVGGLDPTSVDGAMEKSLDTMFQIALDYDKGVDIHLHETTPAGVAAINYMVETVEKTPQLKGKLTISHAFALATLNEQQVDKLAHRMVAQQISIASTVPIGTLHMPLKQLHDKGVKVMTGTDSVIDHWSPYGLGDMLEKANLYAQLYIRPNEQNLSRSLFLATGDVLPLNEKGERVWPKAQDDASFVLVDASCSAEAVARISPRTATFHKGQLVWGSVAG